MISDNNSKERQEIKIYQAQIKNIEKTFTSRGKPYQILTLSDGENTWQITNFAKYNVKFAELLNQDYWFAVRGSFLVSFSYCRERLNV